jgi:hypothetical protein
MDINYLGDGSGEASGYGDSAGRGGVEDTPYGLADGTGPICRLGQNLSDGGHGTGLASGAGFSTSSGSGYGYTQGNGGTNSLDFSINL